jgi:hypothetical protein
MRSAGLKAPPDGHWPVSGQGLIVASMARRRDWLTFSHLTPLPFLQVCIHITGAVKAVTRDGRIRGRDGVIYRRRLPGSF